MRSCRRRSSAIISGSNRSGRELITWPSFTNVAPSVAIADDSTRPRNRAIAARFASGSRTKTRASRPTA
jgi:hypothetical protein